MQQTTLVSTTNVTLTSLVTSAKLQSRVPSASTIDDTLFTLYQNTALDFVEKMAEITLVEKVYNLDLSAWPNMGIPEHYFDTFVPIRLETYPVSAVNSIKYYDEDNTQQTLSTSLYETWLSHRPPMIMISVDNIPDIYPDTTKPITIQYTAGYTSVASFPPGSQLAVLELMAYWFQNREAFGRMPDGAPGRVFQSLIDSLRWRLYP